MTDAEKYENFITTYKAWNESVWQIQHQAMYESKKEREAREVLWTQYYEARDTYLSILTRPVVVQDDTRNRQGYRIQAVDAEA